MRRSVFLAPGDTVGFFFVSVNIFFYWTTYTTSNSKSGADARRVNCANLSEMKYFNKNMRNDEDRDGDDYSMGLPGRTVLPG